MRGGGRAFSNCRRSGDRQTARRGRKQQRTASLSTFRSIAKSVVSSSSSSTAVSAPSPAPSPTLTPQQEEDIARFQEAQLAPNSRRTYQFDI